MKKIWKLSTDLISQKLFVTYSDGESRVMDLYSPDAFETVSDIWVKTGWATKFSYNFSWLGRPIIQLPEDLLMMQEVIFRVRPDVIIETGVAHGGGCIFYASMMQLLGGQGRVIGVDIEIRPHNRQGIEKHFLANRIHLIERSSTASDTLEEVKSLIKPNDTVLVVLDSNHTKAHVARELELYAPLISSGSYIVATDGNMDILYDVPGGKPEWRTDNPRAAAHEFLASHPEFELDSIPTRLGVTYWPDAYLKKR